ncbi:MAG: hypothetical protein OXP28_08050 [Gammaproteobacteria bacterium]|nr:hypothetical protein [Gammaproteobacteria bacterium]
MTLTTTGVFAAGAGDSDEAAADDCGVASNCGGLGGWRVILLATEPSLGEDPSDSEPVEDPVEPVGNQAPNRVGSIRDQALTVGGESATVDVAPFFSDPDGDDLTYRASSSNDRIATVTVSGSDVTVAPAAEGTATITVTATDPGGLMAEQIFAATVSAEGGSFGAIAYDFEVSSDCPGLAAGIATSRGSARQALDAAVTACDEDGGSEANCREKPVEFEHCGALHYCEHTLATVVRCAIYRVTGPTLSGVEAPHRDAPASCLSGTDKIWTNDSGVRISGCNSQSSGAAVILDATGPLVFKLLWTKSGQDAQPPGDDG